MVSKKYAKEVIDYLASHGKAMTLKKYRIGSETLRRYKRFSESNGGHIIHEDALLTKLKARYSQTELEAIASGNSIKEDIKKGVKVNFGGETIKFGHITDTHIGSKQFYSSNLLQAFEEFEKQKVQFICHTGDVTEGMSHRAGHVYELDSIGYQAQYELACQLFSQAPCKVFAIDGNHDRWYIKSNGAIIVKNIAEKLGKDRFEFLGHDEGNIDVNGAQVRLFHGEDSSSYATSYRIQKIVEAYAGGEKPAILLVGHTHKTIFMPSERNIHCFSGGCLQNQTQWMRGKRIRADVGFWIIEATIRNGEVTRCGGTFYPIY